MKIIWSYLAEKTYYENLDYLYDNWSGTEVHEFILQVDKTMELLQVNPHIFEAWEFDRTFKKGLINKYVSFFYSFNDQQIEVHLF